VHRFNFIHPQPPFLQVIAKKTEEKNRDRNRQAAFDQRTEEIDSNLRIGWALTLIAIASALASVILQLSGVTGQ
jgi:hypothetical protein